jgi:hypothetical protein
MLGVVSMPVISALRRLRKRVRPYFKNTAGRGVVVVMVAQTMCTHVSKCQNDKKKRRRKKRNKVPDAGGSHL